jgi:hypothetical protein
VLSFLEELTSGRTGFDVCFDVVAGCYILSTVS